MTLGKIRKFPGVRQIRQFRAVSGICHFPDAQVLLLSFMGFQDGPFESQLVEPIGCVIGSFHARDHLCCILVGLLGIKTALPDYKDCI